MSVNNSWLIKAIQKLKGDGIIKHDNDVAEALGFSRSALSNYLSNRVAVSKNFKEQFENKFGNKVNIASEPTLGYNKSSSTSNASALDQSTFTVMMVPLVNKYAYGGYQHGFGDDEYVEELPKIPLMVDKEHKGNYRAFEVRGDSMDNGLAGSYKEGYIVFGREIPKHYWKDKLHLRKWKNFVIVTMNDGILIKQISKHDTVKGIITLHSLNEEYEDTEMHLDNVAQLLNVIQANIKE